MSKLRGPRYHLVFVQPNAPQLEAIGKLMAQGKLTIPIESWSVPGGVAWLLLELSSSCSSVRSISSSVLLQGGS